MVHTYFFYNISIIHKYMKGERKEWKEWKRGRERGKDAKKATGN